MEIAQKILFTRAEVAEMLSLSVSTVDVAIARGMLRARRNGRRVLIERREIEKFSRADHPHIWNSDGNRGTSIDGRECFDCSKLGRAVPAVRFFTWLPLCQDCFNRRSTVSESTGGHEQGAPPTRRSFSGTLSAPGTSR
jgi:excisionase family DNA binding protein